MMDHHRVLLSSSARYQTQECVLYGSVLEHRKDLVLQRLKGLCDPGYTEFIENELVFSLRKYGMIFRF